MDDIEIKTALKIPPSNEEIVEKELKELFKEILNNCNWKKSLRDWYIWEYEYKPMFLKIKFEENEKVLDI